MFHTRYKTKIKGTNSIFATLSDKERDLCEKFEVWKEKTLYGRKYIGIERTTFIINPEGAIVARFSKVKVTGHVDDVLKTFL